jgi:catechol 2,3-dioxygenase-like lactoylglutathione lyase family enzyme
MSEVVDHVGIRASDLAASRRMYEASLTELGFAVLSEGEFEGDAYVLFGRGDRDDFALHSVGTEPGRDRVTTGVHVAFIAPDEDSAPSTPAATTPRSCSIPTATTSRPCSTRSDRAAARRRHRHAFVGQDDDRRAPGA